GWTLLGLEPLEAPKAPSPLLLLLFQTKRPSGFEDTTLNRRGSSRCLFPGADSRSGSTRVRCAAIISKVGNLMTSEFTNWHDPFDRFSLLSTTIKWDRSCEKTPFVPKKASSRAALASSRGSHDAQSNGPLGVAKTHRRWSLLFGCVVLKTQNGSMRRGDHVVEAGDSSLPTTVSS
ncbi:hypothetical protein PoMZ_00733, partial [Pyricularia oryzae]